MQENLEKNIDSEKDKNEKNDKKSEDSNQKENDNPDKVDKNKNGKEEDNNNIDKKEIEKNGKDKKEKKEEKEEKEEKVEKEEKEEDKDSLNNDTDNKKSSSNSIKDEEDSIGDFVSNSEDKQDDSGEGEDEENDDEDDIDEDDDDDDDDEDDDKTDNTFSDDKKKKDPYHSYINSKVENFIYFDDLEKGDYLYGIEQNKYYKIININSKSGNKCDKYYISLELIDNLKKTKKEKIKMKKISDNIIYKALNYDNDNNKNENKTKDKKEEEKKDISNKELTTNTNNDDNINEKKREIKKENKNEEKKNENENKNEIKNENENENDKPCNDELSNNNIKKKSNIDDKVLVKDNEKEIENKIENKNENKNESKNENKNESKNESKNEIKENKQDTKEENNKENNKVDKNENIIENNKDKKENKDDDNNKENDKTKNDKKKNNEDPDESNKKLNIKKASNKKNITVSISMKDYLKYTFLQKINIFYINYLNIFHKIDMIININCSINDIIIKFQRLYHIPCDRYSDEKPPLIVFINNKKFSTSNKTRKKYFTPNKFDYKNDYIIILEKENHKFEEIDMGTRNNYINLKGVKIPHFVFSSYYNLQVQSFIISKNLPFLECEVYEVKKELYFNIDPENEKNTKKKVKEFLDLNWKERANLISVIKSGNIRKSKENYDANCFEINRKFILSHGKIYIFLVTSSNKKVYAFNPRHITKDGVVIISKDDKALLSGFKAKKISDFIAYN